MLAASIFVSVPMCIYAAIQRWGTEGDFGVIAFSTRASGTLGNPSYLAAYLLFTMALVIYFLLRAKSVRAKILYYLLLAFQLVMLFNTGTRGAFLGLIGAIITVITVLVLRSHSKKIKYAALGALILSVASISIFFATAHSPLWAKIPGVGRLLNFESALNDIRPRLWTWGTALSGVMEKPVLGWGAENFPFPFDKYYNPNHFGIESFFDRAHNNYLEMASAGGVPLLILYLLPFFFYYRELHRRQHTAWTTVLYAVPVAYFIQAFFLFDVLAIYVVHYLFMAFFINSANPDMQPTAEEPTYTLTGKGLIISVGLSIVSVILTWVTAVIPMQKNLILVRALQMEPQTFNPTTQEQAQQTAQQASAAFQQYLLALDTYSPIGQEETMGMFSKYVIRILEQGKLGNVEEVKKIVSEANARFDENQHLAVGVKDLYINGGLNLRAGTTYKIPEYVERGKKMLNDALVYAPTRVELIQVLLNVARYENDSVEVKRLAGILKSLRPDLNFVPPSELE